MTSSKYVFISDIELYKSNNPYVPFSLKLSLHFHLAMRLITKPFLLISLVITMKTFKTLFSKLVKKLLTLIYQNDN